MSNRKPVKKTAAKRALVKQSNRILIVAGVLVAALVAVALFRHVSTLRPPNVPPLSEISARTAELKERVLNDAALETEVSNRMAQSGREGFYVVFLSLCNQTDRARVFHGTGKTLAAAFDAADRFAGAYVREVDYDVKWVKADIVDSVKQVDIPAYNRELEAGRFQNFVRYGVALDKNFNNAFLEAEVNGNKMVTYYTEGQIAAGKLDYSRDPFNYANINAYNRKHLGNAQDINNISGQFYIFTARGFFCEGGRVFDLYSNVDDYGRRVEPVVDDNVILGAVNTATEYLYDMLKPDGSFTYGYWPVFDNTMGSYNIMRHTSSIWSLINFYRLTGDESLKPKINRAIRYLISENNGYLQYRDPETAYIVEKKANEIKIGANGVAVIMLTEYMDVFENQEYVDLVAKLANGILELQNEDGSFYHILNYPGFTKKEAMRTVYYDGESTFGLTRAYTYTKDQKYLDAAAKAVDYFITKDYTRYRDHWVAYALNEITKYIPSQEYYAFALQNVSKNLRRIYNQETSYHTYLELLMVSWQTYQRLLGSGMEFDYPEGFDAADFAATIYRRAYHMLNGYFYPEYAMYMKYPSKALGAFFVRHDNYRIRIDDIQHFIGGFYWYTIDYEQIASYLDEDFLANPPMTFR